jgi:nucleoside-diphosphate-sugar epimerase
LDDLTAVAGLRCLVTGGTGFIGSALVRRLEVIGANVMAPTSKEMDVADFGSVERYLTSRPFDLVFHLAARGVAGNPTPAELRAVNVEGVENVAKVLLRHSSRSRVVFAGSSFEYVPSEIPLQEDDPVRGINAYGVSKTEASSRARAHSTSLSSAWVRIFNVYGPGESLPRILPHLVSCAEKGIPADVTDGSQVRDFVHIDDVAEALIRVGLSLGGAPRWEIINLGSGRPTPLREFISSAVDSIAQISRPLSVRFGARQHRPDDPAVLVPDVAKMRQLLHWQPMIGLKQGIDATVRAAFAKGRHKTERQ